MAETLVKEKICNACGAEIRPQAVFCYNCGSAVAPDVSPVVNNTQKISDAWFRGDLVEERKDGNESEKIENEAVENEPETGAEESSETEIDETPEKRDLSKMDSAANLRRRGKSIQKKRVEIVWEEHDNAPNGWFIFFALVFVILAAAIWLVSTYLE